MNEEEVLYEPSAVQKEAHSFQSQDIVEILYGGTAGCGKTIWIKRDPYVTQIFEEHERYLEASRQGRRFKSVGRALHLRREFTMLQQTIEEMKEFAFKWDPEAKWSEKHQTIFHKCGYSIKFGHLNTIDDYMAYDSSAYTHISFDEATQFFEIQFKVLSSRVRTDDPILSKKLRIVLASNCDSPKCGRWVKERFVDPAPEGRKIIREFAEMFDGTVVPSDRIYIPAYLSDNPNKEYARAYERTLRKLPEHLMKARLLNDWEIVEGAFFAHEFIPSVHVVKPFTCKHGKSNCPICKYSDGLPDYYPRVRSMDYGYKKACPILRAAVTGDGDIIVFRETTYNHKLKDERLRKDAQAVAISIRNEEKAHGEWDDRRQCSKYIGPADYQICAETGSVGPTIEQTMAGEGIYWVKSIKDHYAGTQEVLRRLKDIPTRPGARPGIVIYENCIELIHCLKTLRIDESNPELPELGANVADHWYDALMYLCMYVSGWKAEIPKLRHGNYDDDDDDDEKQILIQVNGGYGL